MRAAAFSLATSLCLCATLARADDTNTNTAAWRSNRGFQTTIGPSILFPTNGSNDVGFGLELGLRYGLKVGPTVLAPGGRLAGYYIPKRFAGDLMPTLRWTIPLGPFAPFLEAGAGPGLATNPSRAGVGLLAGVGFMIHFGDVFGLGARGAYETIVGTQSGSDPRISVFSVGPLLQLGF